MNRTSAQLKAIAKEHLMGNYGIAIGAFLLLYVMSFAASFLTQTIVQPTTLWRSIFCLLITLLVQVFFSIFQVGQAKLYMNIASKREALVTNLFDGFKMHPDKAILLSFLYAVITFLPALPMIVLSFLYGYTQSNFVLLLCIPASLAAIVFCTLLALTYSQCFYIFVDLPDYSAKEILQISSKIMKGHKGRYFYLEVSFIGVALLGLLSFGIGLLWVVPYMNTTYAHFYLDLMEGHRKPEETYPLDNPLDNITDYYDGGL